jgi:hypothetical protein
MESLYLVVKNKEPSPGYLFLFHHPGILEGCSPPRDVGYPSHAVLVCDTKYLGPLSVEALRMIATATSMLKEE